MTTQTEKLIDQITELAEQLGGEVAQLTCYDAKNQWKKLTIEYDREAKS